MTTGRAGDNGKAATRRWRVPARWLPPASLIAAILILWQIATGVWEIEPYILPSPLDIVRAAGEAGALLGPHIWQTTQETLLGFGLALTMGLVFGFAIDASPVLRNALYPLLVTSQTIPIMSIAPLLVIWFGYGIWPKIFVVGLVCFFPIAISTSDGLRSADPDMIALVRAMGATPTQVLIKVRLPGAMPVIFSGIRIAISYSVVGAIMGEWVGASRGLGIFMLRATNSFRTDWVFVSIAVVAAISITLFLAVSAAEHLALPWYYTAARETRWEEI